MSAPGISQSVTLANLKPGERVTLLITLPDVNGDPEAMRALNEARDALKALVAV